MAMLERVLKLSIPNHLIWLTWFYLLFHSLLNTLGEILRFADREFYKVSLLLFFYSHFNQPVDLF